MKRTTCCALILLLVSFGISPHLLAQNRLSKTINSNWNFHKGDIKPNQDNVTWEQVSVPHSWNTLDVMDDEPGYYRGAGWYKKSIFIPSDWKDKDIYIYFEGAAQVAEVFINGKSIGKHIGGYNFFNFKINEHLKFVEKGNAANQIMVRVDNSHSEDIAPLSADFTFFGGLYRDVHLKALNKVHFDMDNYASNGVFITTPTVNTSKASVNVKGSFINNTNTEKNISVTHTILNADGTIVASQSKNFKTGPKQKINFNQDFKSISNPILWSIENPYLYQVISTLTDTETNSQIDEISNPLGFRWFNFDSEKGFLLNGKPVKLIGASRHQDFKNKGNALSDAMHIRDVELLKEMGGNFLRIAHYPQDPAILEACDRLGILASVETPLVNRITETEAFSKNAHQMHLEMIRQNYNHPSLIIWAYMNEILLRPRYEKDSAEQEKYFNAITKLAQELEDITREEDPYRYTLIPNHGNFDLYRKVQLTSIPKLVGWNLYHGWYGANLAGFGDFLDQHRKFLPNKPLLVTEYGADADNRLHDFNPVRFDKTVEYTTIYHQAYLKAINERPFVAAGMIWNLAEFNSEERAEAVPHINNKGILTLDRKPKDAYRFYQANLLKIPYLQIGSKEWNLRTGFAISDDNLTCVQPVQIFTNQKNITLKLNGKIIGSAEAKDGIASFNVPFSNGINRLVALSTLNDTEISDQADINFKLLSQNLNSKTLPFQQMSISLGDNRFFYDEINHEVWLPEQEYQPGSWGYIGGNVFKMAKKGRHSYGSDKNILGTDLDPIFETQRTGIKQFKFDVPNGDYEVYLHFAELLSKVKREELAYNLSTDKSNDDEFRERIFDIKINDIDFLKGFNNLEDLEPERAISVKTRVNVRDKQGIAIDFNPIKGEAILNGIQLRKIR
ncbi:MAG: glycoside hydrolase family 2 TIM barrel-domain containing protein [Pedobacter sp.]|uniref:glycoside hydrolase family 2 TIM barrel-domain containing protein n=1 Tax=Pedobacter sp. TaxID=1411316 RepID=UPI00280A2C78|nr:glycoside hydrolase family 2 TIM barrel-domain containing protein [Pedobacter sp.]MDQ8005874.1 glycoside hydrolase family 2 TIM barrel-domain containing protein [Pedobacter sp.]